MRSVATHIFPQEGGWAIQKQGSARRPAKGAYRTQKEALEAARQLLLKRYPSKIVIHRRDGTMRVTDLKGVSPIARQPGKSSLGRKAIQRAVSAVILERIKNGS